MSGIGMAGAFLAGLAALLSPCSALLLPSFFAYAFGRAELLIRRTVVFWVGLCAVLVPLGAGVGAVGEAVTRHRGAVTLIGGLVLIALGALTVFGGGVGLPGVQRLTGRIRISTTLSVLALGAVYGLAGFCAGPLLGAVLTVSAMGGEPGYGALVMALYALGMAAPLFLLAAVWERFGLAGRRRLRGRPVRIGPLRTHTTSLITGLVMAGIGALFILSEGTAGLGGVLSVDAEYDLQLWLGRVSESISGPAVLLGVVAALIVWRAHRLWRRTRASAGAADGTPETQPSYYDAT